MKGINKPIGLKLSNQLSTAATVIFLFYTLLGAGIGMFVYYVSTQTLHIILTDKIENFLYPVIICTVIGLIKGYISSIDYEYKSMNILLLGLIENNTRKKDEIINEKSDEHILY